MCQGVLYLRSHRRRPVWVGSRFPVTDVQGQIPAGWCSHCGAEVFAKAEVLCYRCKARKEGGDDGK